MTKNKGSFTRHRRIWLDDSQVTLKHLLLLWKELPQDVRINESSLPSSLVVFEALEYIRKLKSILDIHDLSDRITELDDIYDDRLRDLGAFREIPNPVVSDTKPLVQQTDKMAEQDYNQTTTKSVGTPTIMAAQSATAQFALLNGKLVKIAPYTGTATPVSQSNSGVGQPRPTLMPPGAGQLVYTKQGSTGSTAIRLEKQGNSQQHPVATSISASSQMTVEASLAVASAVAKVRASAPDETRHGLHCLDTCPCKEPQLELSVLEKFSTFKTDTYKDYAIHLMISGKDDEDPTTREPAVREHLFYSLFELCSYNLKKMRKLLLVISPDYACDRFEVSETALPSTDSCVLVSRKAWEQETSKVAVVELLQRIAQLHMMLTPVSTRWMARATPNTSRE